jgi:hypothetical protein
MFKFSEQSNYMMPAHFGGWPGQPQPATARYARTRRYARALIRISLIRR